MQCNKELALQKLKKFLDSIKKLKKSEWLFLKTLASYKKVKKGEVILKAGDVCNNIYFVCSGLLRGYIINKDGRDYTWHIFFNNEFAIQSNLWAVDYESFLKKTKSKITIEVLKDSELLVFSRNKIEMVFKTHIGAVLGMIISQEAYCILHNYVISYVTEEAIDRFRNFMRTSSHWFDLVPQKYIATHLGIAPESLSRLKRQFNSE